MGYLQKRHGIQMIGTTRKGTCLMCGVAHAPEMPHNQQSLTYQYKFYDQYGRFPSWADAMAHCPEEVKAYWKKELEKRGYDVDHIPETGRMELMVALDLTGRSEESEGH